MKMKLDNKDLMMVSGGLIGRSESGAYIIYGIDDSGQKIQVPLGKYFDDAVEFDYAFFKNYYSSIGLGSEDEVKTYYKKLFKISQIPE